MLLIYAIQITTEHASNNVLKTVLKGNSPISLPFIITFLKLIITIRPIFKCSKELILYNEAPY